MQGRQPTYRDLLGQGITQEQLNAFLSKLTIKKPNNTTEKLQETAEINHPFHCGECPYYTALSYATDINDIEMVKALLAIGAHPNIASDEFVKGSALLIALHPHQVKYEIFALLLLMPDINIYVLDGIKHSAFQRTRGDATLILRLLEADAAIATCTSEEKAEMATNIASTIKIASTMKTDDVSSFIKQTEIINFAVCENIKKAYPTAQEIKSVETVLNLSIPGTSSGQPFTPIVLSYLFQPKTRALEHFESLYGTLNSPPEKNTLEENKPKNQERSCSMM